MERIDFYLLLLSVWLVGLGLVDGGDWFKFLALFMVVVWALLFWIERFVQWRDSKAKERVETWRR